MKPSVKPSGQLPRKAMKTPSTLTTRPSHSTSSSSCCRSTTSNTRSSRKPETFRSIARISNEHINPFRDNRQSIKASKSVSLARLTAFCVRLSPEIDSILCFMHSCSSIDRYLHSLRYFGSLIDSRTTGQFHFFKSEFNEIRKNDIKLKFVTKKQLFKLIIINFLLLKNRHEGLDNRSELFEGWQEGRARWSGYFHSMMKLNGLIREFKFTVSKQFNFPESSSFIQATSIEAEWMKLS